MLYQSLELKENTPIKDNVKIKEEYALLNEQINIDNNRKYPNVKLDDDNVYQYINEIDIIPFLKEQTGYLLFCSNKNAYCRTLVPILNIVAKENNISTINYFNIENIESILQLDDSNHVIIKEKGSNTYYEILQILDSYLKEYYLKDDKGNEIDTLEKKVIMPSLIKVENGVIKKIKTGTIDSQKSGYDALTSEEEASLKKELENFLITN